MTHLEALIRGYMSISGSADILFETKKFDFKTVLDIGFGKGGATLFFMTLGKK